MAFNPRLPNQLTKDLDDNRINSAPSIVRDKDGRLIVFYAKNWWSGRQSEGRVRFTPGTLDIQVDAGFGEIHGVPVTWDATNLVGTPSTYSLIYVDLTGTVQISIPPNMTVMQDAIVLGFANIGSTAVVNMEEVEKFGNYIFTQRQRFVGNNWEWEDYEYRLNSGEEPYASYDANTDRLYLSYKRDGNSYIRIFDLTNPLTWEYVHHFTVTASNINLDIMPARTASLGVSGGSGKHEDLLYQIFEMVPVTVGYRYLNSTYIPHVHLPWLTSAYLSYIVGDAYLDVFSYNGNSYNLEISYIVDKFVHVQPVWTEWTLPPGQYFLGVRVKHTLFTEWYTTPEDRYQELYVPPHRDYTIQENENYNSKVRASIYRTGTGGGKGLYQKTNESAQDFKVKDDTATVGVGSGIGFFVKTPENDQSVKFVEDIAAKASVGGGIGFYTKTLEL